MHVYYPRAFPNPNGHFPPNMPPISYPPSSTEYYPPYIPPGLAGDPRNYPRVMDPHHNPQNHPYFSQHLGPPGSIPPPPHHHHPPPHPGMPPHPPGMHPLNHPAMRNPMNAPMMHNMNGYPMVPPPPPSGPPLPPPPPMAGSNSSANHTTSSTKSTSQEAKPTQSATTNGAQASSSVQTSQNASNNNHLKRSTTKDSKDSKDPEEPDIKRKRPSQPQVVEDNSIQFPLLNYEKIAFCGDGTFGKVYSARYLKTGEIVALKKIKNEGKEGFPRTAIREITLLRRCVHDSILKIREVVWGPDTEFVFIVMDYYQYDLRKLLDRYHIKFTIPEIKYLMRQLLSGIDYLHKQGILHRDIKTENLLMNNQGSLKICDFGLARLVKITDPPKAYTPVVITLWYRPPELLLGPTTYSSAVDIWSVGCILGELIRCSVLFPGNNELDQLDKIFSIVGTPTDLIWPDFYQITQTNNLHIKTYPNRLGHYFPPSTISGKGFQLLEHLLASCPDSRYTADIALRHPYFQEEPLASDRCDSLAPIPISPPVG